MVLTELQTFLAAAGLGLTADVNLFYGILPDAPDVVVSLFEYGGRPNEPDLGTGGTTTRLVYPRVQVLCRGTVDDYTGPRLMAQNIVTALTAVVNTTLSGVRYDAIEPIQDPFQLRRDELHRVEIVCNYQVTKGISTS